jgi:DtxR family Mn-dependent transcriptional regulator
VIYGHTEWQPDPMTPSQLAARLGLAPSTVTEMVKKLVAAGHVAHALYGAVQLTDQGRAEALRMVRRHRLVETWLVSRYGYGWDEVHDEAEVLEHALSDRLLDEIDTQLGHPVRDPHGDPIPSADGRVTTPDAVLLSGLGEGGRGTIARVSDRDAAVLRALDAAGLGLDSEVAAGRLSSDVAEAVWVVPL